MAWNRQQPIMPTPQSKPKVLIGVLHEAKIYSEWSYRMLPALVMSVPWCDKVHQLARGIPIPVARDQIADAMLKDKSITHLLWVDSDNVCSKPPDPNAALQMLLGCNQPVVSGLYRAKQKEGFNYAMWMDAHLPDKPGFVPIQSWSGNWLQVDVVGFGFVLIQRQVYETCPAPWHVWDKPGPSEDFSACVLFRKYGFKINVFTEVQLRHLGELAVNPDGSVTTLEV